MKFSVCVLLYGDHLDLAQRCLGFLVKRYGHQTFVQDFRIGLNNVSKRVHEFAQSWAVNRKHEGMTTILYEPLWSQDQPALKYPVMRRMLYDDETPAAPLVMWFDDDSFADCTPQWWHRVTEAAERYDVVGQVWKRPMLGNQWKWIMDQAWSDKRLKPQDFSFVQGAWWCAWKVFLHRQNWPIPELRHCGGDAMFGELCRHQNATVLDIRGSNLDHTVAINADGRGRDSKAIRRGYSEEMIGVYYDGTPLPTSHNDFQLRRWVVRPE